MTPERWQRIKEIAFGAMDLPVAERASYIRSECCGDSELQQSVERMIREDSGTSNTLEQAVGGAAADLNADPTTTESLVGRTVSHYRIIEKVGEGGMGVVYKAEDEKLHRPVALKFLRSGFGDDHQLEGRFTKEAEAAAVLDHPNITTIYELGEDNGRTFIAMAFEVGNTLSAKIRERPLPLRDALKISTQVAEGLQAAHERDVVHRDIKPGNIMLTSRGGVKVMDFGLAHLAGQTRMTKTGTIMGTPAYMSPEQTRGETVDHRSDIWSLGVVLYEMVTGRLPFGGETAQEVALLIQNEFPEPPTALRSGLPTELDRIVSKAMAKRAAERYQHVDELLVDLRNLQKEGAGSGTTPLQRAVGPPASASSPSTEATPSEVPRVAVLPLKTRAGDAELASLGEGLTEEITAGLSQFRHLVVVSASAVAGFQEPADVRQVGKELGARFVIGGSIRKAGSSIRVSVQLLDGDSGAHLWAERFDRDLGTTDIFAAQDELTDRIVATVADSSGVLTRSLAALTKAKPFDTLTAHECVLRTFAYCEQMRPDEHAAVRTALERALKREPSHTEALACLSRVYLDEYRHAFNALPNVLDRALHTAQQAVELDATSQLAYRSLAEAHYFGRELSAFRPAAERALSLNPRDTSNVAMIGLLIALSGDWPRGCSVVQKAMQLNPHHAGWLHFIFVHDHYRKREYEQALEAAEKINIPGYPWASGAKAAINAQLGRAEAARNHLETFLELAPELAPDYAQNFLAEASKWWFASAELGEHFLEGLRKAGLEVEGDE